MDSNDQNQNFPRHDGEFLDVVGNSPSPVRSIFLSSTFDDLREYLERVKTAIEETTLRCSNKDWITAYVQTVDKCRQRLCESDGYIGIFAHWYGSIPPNSKRSITHLEFQWAKEKWKSPAPPIAIFMPEKSSEADDRLKEKALEVMFEREVKQEDHDCSLKLFHKEVDDRNNWRMIVRFKDLIELCQRVTNICNTWQNLTPMAAAKKEVTLIEKYEFDKVSDEDFGLLGRQKQVGDLRTIINMLPTFPAVPAIAFLVSGDQNAGQEKFLRQILRPKLISGRPTDPPGRPQIPQYDLDSLIKWLGDSVGVLVDGKQANTVEELALLIHEELQNQQLSAALDEIHGFVGGVAKFYELFWTPLFEELARLRAKELEKPQAQNKKINRLILVIVDYSGKSKQWASITAKYGGKLTEADYSKLFLLKLTDITEPDIFDWFGVMEVPEEKRADLAEMAMKGINDKPDGTPLQVFRRLSKYNLWN